MAGIDGEPNPWAGDVSLKGISGRRPAADAMAVSARAAFLGGIGRRWWAKSQRRLAKILRATERQAGEGGTALA